MRKGLTLIELVATLAIAGGVLAGAMGALASMSRTHTLGERSHRPVSREDRLRNLLAVDVMNAQRYRNTSDRLELQTHSTLRPRDLALRHVPAMVTYEVKQVGSRHVLLRRQQSGRKKAMTEIVSFSVRSIRLRPPNVPENYSAADFRAVPDVAVVAVDTDDGTTQLTFRRR